MEELDGTEEEQAQVNASEHIDEAIRLLERVDVVHVSDDPQLIPAAQVHATLAVAAAVLELKNG